MRMMFFIFVAATAMIRSAVGQTKPGPPATVDHVDLGKYAGQWYEISKKPNRFQRACAGGTTARYAVRPDGMVEVVNRCRTRDGETREAKGIARVVDTASNARLKVSFVRFLWRNWFWGDYWIIGLGREYDYAIVGGPDRKYGWVLARKPDMDPRKYSEIAEELRQRGYNPDEFELTPHP
jgi:apolipoprotein D and lipocalin family protein